MFNLRKQWSTVLLIILLLIVVIFSVLNVDPVNINFGFTILEMPLVVVIIGTLLLGVLIAVIWSTTLIMRERSNLKKANQKMSQLEVDYTKKEQELTTHHEKENQKLQQKIEHLLSENKKLNRHIHNLEITRSTHQNGHHTN